VKQAALRNVCLALFANALTLPWARSFLIILFTVHR